MEQTVRRGRLVIYVVRLILTRQVWLGPGINGIHHAKQRASYATQNKPSELAWQYGRPWTEQSGAILWRNVVFGAGLQMHSTRPVAINQIQSDRLRSGLCDWFLTKLMMFVFIQNVYAMARKQWELMISICGYISPSSCHNICPCMHHSTRKAILKNGFVCVCLINRMIIIIVMPCSMGRIPNGWLKF